MCGEKRMPPLIGLVDKGSPPRVRGKVKRKNMRVKTEGITPACAGKSTKQEKLQGRARDHPRVCGEKLSATLGLDDSAGSPPRVRGKD